MIDFIISSLHSHIPEVHEVAEEEGGGDGERAEAKDEDQVDDDGVGVDGEVEEGHVAQHQVRQRGLQEGLGAQVRQDQAHLRPQGAQAHQVPADDRGTCMSRSLL